jgi:hypothetical protein
MLFIMLVVSSCEDTPTKSVFADPELKVQVGDIDPNPEIDGDFQNCNVGRLPQYYAYKEKPFVQGKLHFERYIRASYEVPKSSEESGLLRIRFTVNCHGESGRFRLLGMNENYEEVSFSSNIVDQLLNLTKSYKEWRVLSYNGMESDYYFYITFKIKNGQLKEVLP